MRPREYDIDPANANLIGFASNVTGATFTLTANDSGDSLAHQVSVKNDSATDHSAKTLTFVGTDPDGFALTETISAPGTSATVETAGYYLTLTSVTVSATIGADTFDIGWVDEVSTRTIQVDDRSSVPVSVGITVTGTIDFTVQETLEALDWHLGANGKTSQNLDWHGIITPVDLLAITANAVGLGTIGATAIRLIINSYTDTAELQMHVSQPHAD